MPGYRQCLERSLEEVLEGVGDILEAWQGAGIRILGGVKPHKR